MKYIKKITVLTLLSAFVLTSCEDEQILETYDENTIAQQIKVVDVNKRIATEYPETSLRKRLIIVRWEGWGHGEQCKGWGLCQAEWFPQFKGARIDATESGNGAQTLLEFDEELNQYYIDILLAETPPTDMPSESLTLKIDEDFDLDIEDELAQNLTFVVGDYPYNELLSTNGGYRIYLQ
jgi:hypothetical protein